MTALPDDPTLDEVRAAIAPELPANAAFDGWNATALDATAAHLGVDPDIARAAFPGGAVEMIDAWFHSVDLAVAAKLPPETLAPMKIRERITALVEARLDIVAPHREALRRALAILAMPQNVAKGARLGWRAADRRNHAFRKDQGAIAGSRPAPPQPVAVHRSVALSGGLVPVAKVVPRNFAVSSVNNC